MWEMGIRRFKGFRRFRRFRGFRRFGGSSIEVGRFGTA
jgi:hypothetical protein